MFTWHILNNGAIFEYVNGYFGFLKLGCGPADLKSDAKVPDNIVVAAQCASPWLILGGEERSMY